MAPISRSSRKVATTAVRSLQTRRPLSTTPARQGSPLFALGALSNSRETQHFAKESRLSRIEHSPNLQLIQSSEVAPFASPKPPPVLQTALDRQPPVPVKTSDPSSTAEDFSETELISLGRAILVEKNAEIKRLERLLEAETDRSMKREATYALARTRSRDRIAKLNSDLSSEKLWKWTLMLIAAATGAWIAASKTGSINYSFGDAYFGSKSPKVGEPAERKQPALLPKPASPPVQPRPAAVVIPPPAVVDTPPSQQSSWFGRLFWTS